MKDLKFPITLKFKISTFSDDFTATDAYDNTIAYVKQKMFKLKEDILVYEDETKSKINYQIKADRWIDFSAAYSITDSEGNEIGKIARKGWKSIFKAEYDLVDQHQQIQFHIREDNAWIKVIDSLLGEIPVLGFLTGYIFNPSYNIVNLNSETVAILKKQPSFWGRIFEISKIGNIDSDDEQRIMLGLMMMILLERSRG